MAKVTQLEITWDGPLDSLRDHRVSLSAFGEPLNLLLTASRRIASNMVSMALSPAETGRLAKEAHQIDIELSGIVQGSSGVATTVTFNPPQHESQQPLFNLLTENVGIALLTAIENESMGTLANAGVRNYLQSLPASLTRQSYNLHENGRHIKRVDIGKMELPETPQELPHLCQITGRVVGVGFEPGRPEVRLRSGDGRQVTIPATSVQVDRALEYRTAEVKAVWLKHGLKTKLLRLEDTSLPDIEPNQELHIFSKWNNLLTRLAQ